jgi:hypothetical protein
MSKPDPSLLQGIVSPRVLAALDAASNMLANASVRHVVVGGLAVGANGYPRATGDVDFLVGSEAFVHHAGGILTLGSRVPFQVDGVAIDYLSPGPDETFLDAALSAPPGSMIEAAPLIYLKLKSPRLKDRADVVELIKGGIDVDLCRAYLTTNAPAYLAEFEAAISRAIAEE